ncbi:MAG TPA: M20/M25/M40 family metallo-hydrolase [Thermoanaerobaculia bacterium]|nr:M20/M25/M40 family metallo-hydrolase [Thermoanaerobaculia bacterium]
MNLRPLSKRSALALLALLLASPLFAAEHVDLGVAGRIREEGLNHGKVMETASELCDEIGPRLTGSPGARKAAEWAKAKLAGWGLVNAHLESWAPFGRGWTWERAHLAMLEPAQVEIPAIPRAWTPGTGGVVKGAAILAKLETDEDLAKWKGKLAGKIVLAGDALEVKLHEKADATRHTKESLEELSKWEPDTRRPDARRGPSRFRFQQKLVKFLEDEKVLAVLEASARGDDGTVFVQASGQPYKKDRSTGPPALAVPAEAYGRIARVLFAKRNVTLELDVATTFLDEDPLAAANVVAEILGTDKKDEVVMLGAHLDSWHGGTGATDNGAGSTVVLEAARILKAIGATPRRTIRVALWTGEEQGLLGSRAYVASHFASRPEPSDPAERDLPEFLRRSPRGPITFKPEWKKLAAYFNLDNGTGKVRGVYCQENAAVAPIFREWLVPFHDLGATALTMRRTGGTDHLSFDAVGLPGFQFIQDELDYDTRTHHSNMDVYERLQKSDLQQASVLMAAFVWNAATRDEMLPRKPVPPEPERPPREDEDEAKGPGPAKAPAPTPAAPSPADRPHGDVPPMPHEPPPATPAAPAPPPPTATPAAR